MMGCSNESETILSEAMCDSAVLLSLNPTYLLYPFKDGI